MKSPFQTKPSLQVYVMQKSPHTHSRCFPEMEESVSGSLSAAAAGAANPVYQADRLNATEQDNVMEFIAARHPSSEGCCC